jgi:hypothetical protein
MGMDAAAPDTARSLGWPWDALADAVGRRRDAERFAAQAMELGTGPDRAKAAFELESALGRERACRDELAGLFLLMLGEAIKHRPEALFGKVMAAAEEVMWKSVLAWLADAKPGGAESWQAMSRRLAGAEEAASKARAEAWELGNWVHRLEREIETLKAGIAHGDREPNQGPAGGRGAGDERQAG